MPDHHRTTSRLRFLRAVRERRNVPAPAPGAPVASNGRSAAAATSGKPTARHRSLWTLYRELFGLLRGNRREVATALGALAIGTVLGLIPPAATKLVIDNVLLAQPLPARWAAWTVWPGSPRGRLIALVVAVLIVSILGMVVGTFGRWRATVATKRMQVKIRRKVFEHAVRLPLHRVYELKSGGAASLIREDAGGAGDLILSMIYRPASALIELAGGAIILLWIDWRLLLVSFLLLPGAYWSERIWNRLLRPLYRAVRLQRQEIDGEVTETFGGMRVVRAFGRQRRESARFVGQNHFLARQEMNAWLWSRTIEFVWNLILPAASGTLLFFGGLQVLEGRMSLGDLSMFLVYLAMLLGPITLLASNATDLQNNLSGFDRVLDLLAEPREMVSRPGAVLVRKAAVAGRVSFENVSFAYPHTAARVLRGIDLEVEPGEVVALVGRSGAGKTTLCNLIARFHDPTEGAARLDGIDLRDIEVESYRRLLGIVEQDVFLFDGTIAENIAYADRRALRGAIERAARLANADEFIERLPAGYDTWIGERGVRLSGGQRQRLAIARAVLADPRIFLLDEATSNLDSESERLIQRGLSALMRGRTSFVIAHRLSTIRKADRILVLEAGAIVETGSHAELMDRSGRYRDMVDLQRLESGE